MYEGAIIKFYREKNGLTQGQLGNGICSITHLSKFERGSTSFSTDLIDLLCKRLNINLSEEIKQLDRLGKHLQRWHEAMIMQQRGEAHEIKKELDQNPFLQLSEYRHLFQLLEVRYQLTYGDKKAALDVITHLKEVQSHLPKYEQNLYLHLVGIYHILQTNHLEAIQYLNLNYSYMRWKMRFKSKATLFNPIFGKKSMKFTALKE